MIEDHNFCFEVRILKRRPKIICQKLDLFARGHVHAGIVVWYIHWLVLHGDGIDGNTRSFVVLYEPHEVFRKCWISGRQKGALDHGAGGLHPAGRAPRRGDDFQVGIKCQGFAQERDDVRAIVVNGEVLEL